MGGAPIDSLDPFGLRAPTANEAAFLANYFGKCIAPGLLDIEGREYGDTDRAFSPPGGGIHLPSRDFVGGDSSNEIDLGSPGAAGEFAHEVLHQLQRQNGVSVTTRAVFSQTLHGLFGGSSYAYTYSNDPQAMLNTFNKAGVESQGQMFQDFVTRDRLGQNTDPFSLIGAEVRGCSCGK